MALSADLDKSIAELKAVHAELLNSEGASVNDLEYYDLKILSLLNRIDRIKHGAMRSGAIAQSAGRALSQDVRDGITGYAMRAVEVATRGAIAQIESTIFETRNFLDCLKNGNSPSMMPAMISGAHLAIVGAFMDLMKGE